MATHVIMPALGVAQQTGTLLKWLKSEGQSVAKGEPLMEIETDKATVEIEAPGSGILTRVAAKAGDEVPVGQRIALILAPGEPLPPEAVRPASVAPTRTTAPKPTAQMPAATSASAAARLLASPAAKRIARERAIDLASVRGSGPEGSILAEDVLRAAPVGPAAATAEPIIPLTTMRRIVAERMTQSKQTAPHFYLSMDVDLSAISQLRSAWKNREQGTVPSINDFILLACARALKDFPALNSSFTERGIKHSADINIGMAVALDEGLVVPVIRNADCLSVTDLAVQSRRLADKAQNKKLLPLDCEGGTFTVSNLGMLGVDSFTAIINPPQCAILAIGRVAPRVVAEADMLAIKPLMTATLSADHRVVDGTIAARYLKRFKHYLEEGKF